jgi:predicted restriction endonuclease
VTEAYNKACAVSGERTLPVLEAAHIKPFAEDGPNRTENGIGALLNQCLRSGIYYTTHHDLIGADYNPGFFLRQCV